MSACLADFGVPVSCVDEDLSRINSMALAQVPYYEKNLAEVVKRGIRAGRLVFSTDLSVLSRKKVVFLAQDSAQYTEEVALRIARMCVDDLVLVISTPVPVGTAQRIEQQMKELGGNVTVVSHPVFLTDGCAVEDYNWPDRILLGTNSFEAVSTMKQLYRSLVMRGVPVIVTSHATAELVREAATAFVATKISFINEIAGLCEHVNADAVDLSLALGLDKKVGPRCLQPGAVFGGAFVETEMNSLAQLAFSKGVNLKVLTAAREVHREFNDHIMEKITGALASVSGKNVALLGLAFKPNTNSVAASSSIGLAKQLLARGAKVKAYDPAAMAEAKVELNGSVNYCDSPYAAAEESDALVLSTGWPEFRALDFPRIKKSVRRAVIVDTKNLLDGPRMRSMGFDYVGMGRA